MKTKIVICRDCGREKIIRDRPDHATSVRCRSCNMKTLAGTKGGESSPTWKGGRTKMGKYIRIKVTPSDFFYSMVACGNTILEHRLIMAKHLGRCLHSWEIVHHRNGIKDDNRIENLQLVSEGQHNQLTMLARKIRSLELKVEEQGKLIRLLQWQIKENKITIRK